MNLREIWEREMRREPVIETEKGNVYYLQPSEDGKRIEYGSATNCGLLVSGSLEYDFDLDFYSNLESVVEKIEKEENDDEI